MRAIVVCVGAGAVCGAPVDALEWSSGHAVAVGAQSESNINLSPTDPQDAQNATASVSAEVLARGPGLSFRLQPEVRAQRYRDAAQSDRNDAFLTSSFGFDDPRQSVLLGAQYARESTLTSEPEESGLLGRLDIEREQRGADARYSRRLRGQHELGIAASDVETSYGSSADPSYGDYGVRALTFSHAAATSGRTARTIIARKSFVDQAETLRTTATTELQATWSRSLSPHLHGTVGVGTFVVERPNGEAEDPSGLLDLALSRNWPRWTFSASLTRNLRAEAGGVVVVDDSLAIGAERRVGERLGVGLQVSGAHSSSAVDGPFDLERTHSYAAATMSWQLARRIDLNASVYERTEVTTLLPRASTLAAFVSLTYRSG